MESVSFPPALRTIGKYAFYRCEDLRGVKFSEGLDAIEAGAFWESGLRSVVFPASLRRVAQAAFAKC